MSLSYLVDTDWIIHYLNGNRKFVERLKSLKKEEGLGISIISLAELYEGIYYSTNRSGNEEGLNNFLTGVTVLGIDEEICKIFGKKRGNLRRQKKMIGDIDLLIASTCLYYNLPLLTNNRKHYETVEGLNILSLS
jgi:tRNA(fMet)-specific endonuclease VapC